MSNEQKATDLGMDEMSGFTSKPEPENFRPENFWAQMIIRREDAGKSYLVGVIRRRYGEGFNDIKLEGESQTIGFTTEPLYGMKTDTDPDSPTFNQRIPDKNTGILGHKAKFHYEITPDNNAIFRKMVGTASGYYNRATQFLWQPANSQRTLPAKDFDELLAINAEEAAVILERRYWAGIEEAQNIRKDQRRKRDT
jgi:hypothetical protein